MPYSRAEPELLTASVLDAAMRGLGMRIGHAVRAEANPDLEVTLVSVSVAAVPRDYRLLGVLAAWLEVHHRYVNVPRLSRFASGLSAELARAWWSAVGTWLGRLDARWLALRGIYQGAPLDLDDAEVTELQLRRVGSDPRFDGGALRVHAKLLRSRVADVEEPAELVARHAVYRKRVEMGPTYRADVWAALDAQPRATAAEIARRVSCAYETARAVRLDWHLVHAALEAA